jgi:hypothetical protein
VLSRQVSASLGRERVELDGGNTREDAQDNLLRDLDRVDELVIQTVAQTRNARGDLVEEDGLVTPVCMSKTILSGQI